MKVYIVCWDYIEEGYEIVGVFTTKERAEEVSTNVGHYGDRRPYDSTYIREVNLDEILGEYGEFTLNSSK